MVRRLQGRNIRWKGVGARATGFMVLGKQKSGAELERNWRGTMYSSQGHASMTHPGTPRYVLY